MGLLDKLLFWKKETVELDYEVSGCFTLPEAEAGAVERTVKRAGTVEEVDDQI